MNIDKINLREHRQKLGLSQAKLAELTGISQHILSAFELGKAPMSEAMLTCVFDTISNLESVNTTVSRPKRYRAHTYTAANVIPERVARANLTPGNATYKSMLDKLFSSHANEKKTNLSAVSLFSGCGGFSLGFSAAGFKIKGFVEKESTLRNIYKLNFPDSIEIGSDITGVTKESLDSFSASLGTVDVIIGGPPCQGFSLSGKREITDPRNMLFKHYLRFVDAFKPKFAVLENVRLLTSMKNADGGFVKDDIYREFNNHGYRIEYFEIKAKNFGVPQHRDRVIFIAVRHDVDFVPSMPEPTHKESIDLFSDVEKVRTFADACSDLPFIESGEKSEVHLHEAVKHPSHVVDWLWDVQEGFSAHDNEDINKRPPSGYNTTYKRQVWEKPGATVQTTFGMISGCNNVHPIATRSLTIREAARLQSFPDDYKFEGTLGAIRTGIGNAVPPMLAYKIAKHLIGNN